MNQATFLIVTVLSFNFISFSQDGKTKSVESLTKELAEKACSCIDNVETYNRSHEMVTKDINKCINEETAALQLGLKLLNVDELKDKAKEEDGKKTVEITVNVNENSEEYKKAYYELERYLMDNCPVLKVKVASNDKQNSKSMSDDKLANEYYSQAIEESEKENYKKAIVLYEKAIKEDPEFVFAWDNMGLNYRKLNNYDKAIECYEKSLSIDPKGQMPLQNIAIAYQYKKDFPKALDAYKRLSSLDRNNPEVYYGIGVIYTYYLVDYELALDNLCKAYNFYVAQKSPYRSDAEKLINYLASEMKKQRKSKRFKEILKENNIEAE